MSNSPYRDQFHCDNCSINKKQIEFLQKTIIDNKVIYANLLKNISSPYLTILISGILIVIAAYQSESKHEQIASALHFISGMIIFYKIYKSYHEMD